MPPPSFSGYIHTHFHSGEWEGDTPLTELPSIGPYLEGRLRVALKETRKLTLQSFVNGFRSLGKERVTRILMKALQNRRSNQCVSPSSSHPENSSYHTGDVNEHGYEATAALLEYARTNRLFNANLRFQVPLPRPGRRSAASRTCGCHTTRRECTSPCRWTQGHCFPRNNASNGFIGSPGHPNQTERVTSDHEARAVRRRANTPRTHQARADPDTMSDVHGGHARTMNYVRRGSRMWRRPSSKVRVPVERRP